MLYIKSYFNDDFINNTIMTNIFLDIICYNSDNFVDNTIITNIFLDIIYNNVFLTMTVTPPLIILL
jgi:hypothetical protein